MATHGTTPACRSIRSFGWSSPARHVDLWPPTPGQYLAAPRGYDAPGKGGSYQAGALIGKVGDTGRTFLIGERYDGAVTEEGKLYLQIIGSPWNNASLGSYRVRIQTENAPGR